MKLILATHNIDKITELKALLETLPIHLVMGKDLPTFPDIDEDQATLQGNALKKARTLWKLYHLPVLADDTGLFVAALNNEPGMYSARYAGEQATYEDNRQKMLTALQGILPEKRIAVFRTVVAYIDETGNEYTVVGECFGRITEKEIGSNGFGYDSIFLCTEKNKTFAEMDEQEKNEVSHRGRALRNLYTLLSKRFSE